jgi:SNF2 family DNA or RNA helicase
VVAHVTLELFKYQEEGARFLAERARAGLFDAPRVGKSGQVVRALDLRGAARGILVVPAVAREQWRAEFDKFALQRRRVVKGSSIHDFVAWANGHFDTLITSYDMMVRWTPYLHDRCEALDFIVFDEGHFLKSEQALRTRTLLGEQARTIGGAVQWAKQAWWLTGTPVPNDPMDILTFLRFQHVMPLGTETFRKRYFTSRAKTYGSAQTAKLDMLPELRALIANNSLRRTLDDTGSDRPPLHATTYLVDGDTDRVRNLLLEHPGMDSTIRDALLSERGLSSLDAPHIATLRRLIGEAKAPAYADLLIGELHSGLDKMVVFAHHKSVLEIVRAALVKHHIRCGMIVGGQPEKEREAVKQAFDADPLFRVVLCNIRAAGVALTLAASAALDMVEVDWAPASNMQAIMRVYGPIHVQRRSVTVRFITLANSFDTQINEIVAEKTKAIAALDAVGGSTLEDMLA